MTFLRGTQGRFVKSSANTKKRGGEIVDFMESKFFSENIALC